jgi:hypothetical protein
MAHPYIQDVRQRLFQILRTSMLRCVQTAFLLPQFCPNQTKTKLDVEGGRRRAITPKRFNPISPSKNNIAAQLPRVISNKTIKCTLPPFSVCFHKTFCHLSSSTGWPDWAIFRLLGSFLKITEAAQILGLLFYHGNSYVTILLKWFGLYFGRPCSCTLRAMHCIAWKQTDSIKTETDVARTRRLVNIVLHKIDEIESGFK